MFRPSVLRLVSLNFMFHMALSKGPFFIFENMNMNPSGSFMYINHICLTRKEFV